MKESAEFGESSHSLRGKKSVCSSRKLKNSEATAKVLAERTPYPELSVQSSQSKLQEKSNVKKAKVAGPEVDTRKQRKPDVKDNVGHDNPGGFFKPQPSGHRGHRKSHDQNMTCDKGVRTSTLGCRTFSHTNDSDVRTSTLAYKRRVFTCSAHRLPDGREKIILLHYGHPLGSREDSRNMVVRRRKGGDIYVEESPEDCCTIL